MPRILVVAYSRSGTSRAVGKAIASAVDADFELIRDIHPRHGLWQYLKSGREALKGKNAPIMPVSRNPKNYDLVILGTPVWAGHIATPLRTYVVDHIDQLDNWAVFCTEGGSGHNKVFQELTKMIGSNPVAKLHIYQKEVRTSVLKDKIQSFALAIHHQSGSHKPDDVLAHPEFHPV